MHPDHEQRFKRMVSDYLERPGGDYGELLHRDRVSSPEGADPEQWRAEIRGQARRDKIRVATFRDGDRAFAVRRRTMPQERELEEMRYWFERSEVLRKLAQTARELGHDPGPWLRSDTETITFCTRCVARIYARFDADPATDGEALNEPCPAGPAARHAG